VWWEDGCKAGKNVKDPLGTAHGRDARTGQLEASRWCEWDGRNRSGSSSSSASRDPCEVPCRIIPSLPPPCSGHNPTEPPSNNQGAFSGTQADTLRITQAFCHREDSRIVISKLAFCLSYASGHLVNRYQFLWVQKNPEYLAQWSLIPRQRLFLSEPLASLVTVISPTKTSPARLENKQSFLVSQYHHL
jgi:hypothetical protein